MPSTQDLPNEIWSMIFQLAVEMPEPDSSRLSPCFPGRQYKPLTFKPQGTPLERTCNIYDVEAFKGTTSLLKVCRRWNKLATPWAYRTIIIEETSQLRSLIETVTQVEASTGFAFGDFVQALYIVPRNLTVLASKSQRMAHFKSIAQMCQSLPNLARLEASVTALGPFCDGDPLRFFHALPPTLKHLYLDLPMWVDEVEAKGSSMCDFTRAHPNLETFAISAIYCSPVITHAPTSIRHLGFKTIQEVQDLPAGTLPKLETVMFPLPGWGRDLNAVLQFLSVHCQGVKALCLVPTPEGSDYREGPYPARLMRSIFQEINRSCPQVREVQIAVDGKLIERKLAWFDMVGFRLRNVNTLALYLEPTFNYFVIHECVSLAWTKILPDLRTIRVMESFKVAPFQDNTWVKEWLKSSRWAVNPVVVEDINGRVLAKFSKGVVALVGP